LRQPSKTVIVAWRGIKKATLEWYERMVSCSFPVTMLLDVQANKFQCDNDKWSKENEKSTKTVSQRLVAVIYNNIRQTGK
jgi:hypothetical protein